LVNPLFLVAIFHCRKSHTAETAAFWRCFKRSAAIEAAFQYHTMTFTAPMADEVALPNTEKQLRHHSVTVHIPDNQQREFRDHFAATGHEFRHRSCVSAAQDLWGKLALPFSGHGSGTTLR
jgi:hypothetical protein